MKHPFLKKKTVLCINQLFVQSPVIEKSTENFKSKNKHKPHSNNRRSLNFKTKNFLTGKKFYIFSCPAF